MTPVSLTPIDDLTVPPLTAAEAEWLRRLNRLLQSCPSDRLACATVGDHWLAFFDAKAEGGRWIGDNDGDFVAYCTRKGLALARVYSTFEIGSTAA